MFTQCVLALCICCRKDDSSDDERAPDLRPLLDRSLSSTPTMPRASRTYGKRKHTVTAAASAIFGTASSPPQPPSSPARAPLLDLTTRISNLGIRAEEDEREEKSERRTCHGRKEQPLRKPRRTLQEKEQTISDDGSNKATKASSSESSCKSDENPVHLRPKPNYTPDDLALLPLVEAYQADCQRELPVEKWHVVLPAGSQVVKIAEASYAEVYRVSIDGSESILKVMQLKIPSDAASLGCETAIEVSQVVSEVRIMNALTEYPGFVTFKDAHLIRGKPCASLTRARNNCPRWDPKAGLSNFPNPITFTENSIFLAIELGDAGHVLEEVELKTIDQVWDIFLGIVIALAAAEAGFNFEHRDLHQNNICVSRNEATVANSAESSSKYGRSGFEVTILDYGLSRATLPNGNTVCNDLENDLGIFQGTTGNAQFDTYRRMRTHLFIRNRTMYPREWHVEASRVLNNGRAWSNFIPYSNVLWIKYIFGYLKKAFKDCGGDPKELSDFKRETQELGKRFSTRTLVANGAFSTAYDVFEFAVDVGWLTGEQVATMMEPTSMLSEDQGEDQSDDQAEDKGENVDDEDNE